MCAECWCVTTSCASRAQLAYFTVKILILWVFFWLHFSTLTFAKKGKNKSLKPRSTQKEVWGFVRFTVTVQTMVIGCCLAYAAYMLQTFHVWLDVQPTTIQLQF